jgi:hypothetical protein
MNSIMSGGSAAADVSCWTGPGLEPAAPDDRAARLRGLYNARRPHRALKQAAPLRPLPDGVTDLNQFRVQRRDRAGGVIHEYRLVA